MMKHEPSSLHFAVLSKLAETLGAQKDPEWQKVKQIVDLCPSPSRFPASGTLAQYLLSKEDQRNDTEDDDDEEPEDMLSEIAQEALISALRFLTLSEGKFADQILPFVEATLRNLPALSWDRYSKISPESFAFLMVSQIRSLCARVPTCGERLASALASIFVDLDGLFHDETVLACTSGLDLLRVIFGLLEGLSEPMPTCGLPPFTESHVSSILRCSISFFEAIGTNIAKPFSFEDRVDSNSALNVSAAGSGRLTRRTKLMKSIRALSLGTLVQVMKHSRESVCLEDSQTCRDLATKLITLESVARACRSHKVVVPLEAIAFLPPRERSLANYFRMSNEPLHLLENALKLAVECSSQDESQSTELTQLLTHLLVEMEPLVLDGGKHPVDAVSPSTSNIVAGLETLASSFSSLASTVVDSLRRAVVSLASSPVRDQVISGLCRVLKNDLETNGLELIRQTVYSTTSQLFASRGQTSSDATTASAIVALLGKIATTCNDPSVSDLVIPSLADQFTGRELKDTVDAQSVLQLVEVAKLGHPQAYREVVNLLTAMYSSPFDISSKIAAATVPSALLQLARGLTDPQLRSDMLSCVLRLFNQVGEQIQNKVATSANAKASALAGHVGILLPCIASLFKDATQETKSDPKIQKSFRHMWFYCVLYGFVTEGVWLEEWFEAVRQIASQGPLLVSERSPTFAEMEAELVPIFRHGLGEKDLEVLRGQLSTVLAAQSPIAISFEIQRCVFLLALYHLESLRVTTSGSLHSLLAYIQETSLSQPENAAFLACIEILTKEVFIKWIESMASSHQNKSRTIEEQVEFLIVSCSDRVRLVRQQARRFLLQCSAKFPHVLFSSRCLHVLLDLVHASAAGFDRTPACTEELSVVLPTNGHEFYLPELASSRLEMHHEIRDVSVLWLRSALSAAPRIVESIIQEYLAKFQGSFCGPLQHLGCSLAIEICAQKAISDDDKSPLKAQRSSMVFPERSHTVLAHAAMVKATHLGEIKAFLDFASPNQNLETILLRNLEVFMKNFRGVEESLREDVAIFNHYIHRATAALIVTKEVSLSILKWIVWAPVYVFTAPSLESAVFCWDWILSARPDIALLLWTEIANAWCWTVTEGVGLFSGKKEDYKSVDMAVPLPQTSTPKRLSDPSPHRKWLSFLAERFEGVRTQGKEFTDVLFRVLSTSVADPYKFSVAPLSFGVRFRLLLLALKLVHNPSSPPHCTVFLREGVYSSALTWFLNPPIWYDPGNKRTIEEDVQVLLEFCRTLILERSILRRARTLLHEESDQTAGGMPLPAASASDIASTAIETVVSAKSIVSHFTGGRAGESEAAFNESAGRFVSEGEILHPALAYDRAKLLTYLVSHELDRIAVWHNPIGYTSAFVQDDRRFTSNKTLAFSKEKWARYVNAAWTFAPRLSIMLALRFPSPLVRNEVEILVRADPIRVIDVPEAVTFLATKQNVAANIPELKHLLNWAPAKLCDALTFFGKEFSSNSHIVQFATSSLRSLSPEVIMFYLPQLVQATRYDSTQMLGEYLLSTVHRSPMFCHQFIWSLRTEFEQENAPGQLIANIKPTDPKLAESVRRLLDSVLSSLDESEMALYKEEFEYFDQIITVAGSLKPFAPELRKEKAVELLANLKVSPHLYLPTNTESNVVVARLNEAQPMRSAAKTPIRIPFEVRQLNVFNNQSSGPSRGMPSSLATTETRYCIFKKGDDCRQDQLALQVIAMFKRIFQTLDLPLFLFPYRVITTAKGCGIIECVPCSNSRDQLGSLMEGKLKEYFVAKYGHEESVGFQRARRNFIESMAAYSVVSYILNIKDRHNGNILLDDFGHIIHIDFGFMFDLSPGGDFGFEASPFKLTKEMLILMGEKLETMNKSILADHSESYRLFIDLTVKGFLAARQHMNDILSLVSLMLESGLPCFKPQTMQTLKARFSPDLSERDAAKLMVTKIESSYDNVFTIIYDKFQYFVEHIDS